VKWGTFTAFDPQASRCFRRDHSCERRAAKCARRMSPRHSLPARSRRSQRGTKLTNPRTRCPHRRARPCRITRGALARGDGAYTGWPAQLAAEAPDQCPRRQAGSAARALRIGTRRCNSRWHSRSKRRWEWSCRRRLFWDYPTLGGRWPRYNLARATA
jgi:hypothetical protein